MRHAILATILRSSGGLAGLLVLLAASSVPAQAQAPKAETDRRTTPEDTRLELPEDNLIRNDRGYGSIRIRSVTQPDNGEVELSPDRDVTYIPDPDFSGTDAFTYTIQDLFGRTDTGTVIVTVTPVNDAPVTQDDAATTAEDTPVTIDVLANDDDPDGDDLAIASTSAPGRGTAVISGGRIRYTPSPDATGTDTFTYTVSDEDGATATATVTVTIDPINDAPDARDDVAETDEDEAVTIDVLANDDDDDGDDLRVTSVTAPADGTATTNGATVTYVPDPDFNGDDAFVYTVTDGSGGTSTAEVTVTVTPVNDAPVARAISFATTEDTPLVVDAPGVLANDDDPDGDALSATRISGPSDGTLSLSADGSFTYTPRKNFTGTDAFRYRASDGNLSSPAVTVTISVGGVNDAPVARDDEAVTDEDRAVTVSVLANDTDPDGDDLRVASVGQPSRGTASVVSGGTAVRYVPAANANGTDAFTYTASDGNGGTAIATVRVTIAPVNDAPVAQDDAATTAEDTPVTVDVLANDADPDGDPLAITAVSTPDDGTVTVPDGNRIRYAPPPDFSGTTSFTYTASDGNGGTTTAAVSITVTAVNDAPQAQNDAATVAEDGRVGIGVLANDGDPEGTSLTVASVTAPSNGTATTDGATVTYVPDPDFNGDDAFVYTVRDAGGASATATVTVTVTPVNDEPVAQDDAAGTDEDTPVTVLVLANDDDPDGDPLTVLRVESAASGTTSVVDGGAAVRYTPTAGFVGTDAFTYTVADEAGGTATATVTITVADVNGAPVAQDDAATTAEDTPVTVDVLANDADPDGDPLAITAVSTPDDGTVEVAGDGTALTYTPASGFTGTDTFGYTVSDGTNTATASVTVTVASEPLVVEAVVDGPVPLGEAVTVDVRIGGIAPTSATLFYRPSGAGAFLSTPLARGGDGYTGTVPAAAVTLRGVDLYVVLSDGETTLTDPAGAPEAEPLHVRVAVDQAEAPVRFTEDGLRMVSVPVALDAPEAAAVFTDDFGSYDPAVWRLFRWDPASERYAEFPSGIGALTPGVGFWLAARADGTFDVDDGLSVRASEPVTLTLQPGWNQIGSPFGFPVAWSGVEGAEAVSPPAGWDGAEYDLDVAVLQPWEGYFVENPTDAPVDLTVPPVEAAEAARTASGLADGYRLRLRAEAGDLRDTQNVVGFAEAARERSEPPPPGDHVRLSVLDGDRRLAHSLRPEAGGGATWEIEVTASASLLGGDGLAVAVDPVEAGALPEAYGRHVLDLDRGVALPDGPFVVRLSDAEPVRRLRVIVGTEAFAASEARGLSLDPPAFALEPARPNPFHTSTTITYRLAEAGPVSLDVFDVLGRHVATLAQGEQDAGRHVVTWEGPAGAQGVYVVRLQAGDASATTKMTLIR